MWFVKIMEKRDLPGRINGESVKPLAVLFLLNANSAF
jgi:hypothetical protein